jgi:hypothetical protein
MRLLTIVGCLVLAAVLPAWNCIVGNDVTDFTFKLPEKTFTVDTATIAVPTQTTIPCQPSPDTCAGLSPDLECGVASVCQLKTPDTIPALPCSATDDPCSQLGPQFTCDLGAGSCMGAFSFELKAPVNLSTEVPELQSVGQAPLVKVSFDYVRLRVEENTLTVDTPPIVFYLSPQSVSTLWVAESNPPQLSEGIVIMGSLPAIQAATWGMTVDVALDPTGNATLTSYCKQPSVPFNMFAGTTIELHAGDLIPQGRITLVVDAAAQASL